VDQTILKMEAVNIVETFVPTYKKKGIIIQDAVKNKPKHVKSGTFVLQHYSALRRTNGILSTQTKMIRAVYVWRNIKGLSPNSCYCGREVMYILSVFVALCIQHAMGMLRIVICSLSISIIFFHIIS
jgi:hypothetical protein